MKRDISALLREGVSHLLSGGTAEQYLALSRTQRLSPAAQQELRALLDTAARLLQLRQLSVPPPQAKVSNRARFLGEAFRLHEESLRAPPRGSLSHFLHRWVALLPRWRVPVQLGRSAIAAALVIVLALAAGGGAVSAAAGSLPGSPLYPLKLAVEDTRLFLTPSQPDRTRLCLRFAGERTDEMVRLIAAGRPVDEAVVLRMSRQFQGAVQAAAAVAASDDVTMGVELLQQVIETGKQQEQILLQASVQAPSPAQPALAAGAAAAHQTAQQAQQTLDNLGNVPSTPTLTPTPTETVVTVVPVESATPLPTPSATLPPVESSPAESPDTPTPTSPPAVPTETATLVATLTITQTETRTRTPTPTVTRTGTAASAVTSTGIPVPTVTRTRTPTRTATRTRTPTVSPQATATPTLTHTRTSTSTVTRTRTATSTATEISTPTLTGSRTHTPTPIVTFELSPTLTSTMAPSPTPIAFHVNLSDQPDPVPASYRIHYTVCAINDSSIPLTHVVLVVRWSPRACAYLPPDNPAELTFAIGTLNAHASACEAFALDTSLVCVDTTLTAEAVLTCDQGTARDESTTSIGPGPTPTPTISPTPEVALSLDKSDHPDPVPASHTIHYNICLTNHSDGALTNVVIVDRWSPRDCVYLVPDNPAEVRWELGTVNAHARRCVQLSLNTFVTCAGNVVGNEAVATCDQGTASAQTTTTIGPAPPPTPTDTPLPAPTNTSLPTPTDTPVPTATEAPVLTPTPTEAPTATLAPTATGTIEPILTPTLLSR